MLEAYVAIAAFFSIVGVTASIYRRMVDRRLSSLDATGLSLLVSAVIGGAAGGIIAYVTTGFAWIHVGMGVGILFGMMADCLIAAGLEIRDDIRAWHRSL